MSNILNKIHIDKEDEHLLDKYAWFIAKDGYVRCSTKRVNGKQRTLRLHREILGAKKGESVDHINGNTLDNLRSNLRIVTHQENMWNKHKVRGYHYHKASGKYVAAFMNKHIGLFDTPEMARSAYLSVKSKFN